MPYLLLLPENVEEGIPCYYRQYGYEYGITHGVAQIGDFRDVPALMEGEIEPYRLRPTTLDDLPTVMQVSDVARRRYLIARHKDDTYWRELIQRMHSGQATTLRFLTIEDADGAPAGFVRHSVVSTRDQLAIYDYEILPKHSWSAITPTVLRSIRAFAAQMDAPATHFRFVLGSQHPAYMVMQERARLTPPAAWYVRVPDLPRLLNHVAPVLERRLAASAFADHTGDVKVSFYRNGLRLIIDQGRITVAPWQPVDGSSDGSFSLPGDGSNAAFPGRVFTQLLCGYRSLDDLEYAYADCGHDTDQTRALITVLFPTAVSHISPQTVAAGDRLSTVH